MSTKYFKRIGTTCRSYTQGEIYKVCDGRVTVNSGRTYPAERLPVSSAWECVDDPTRDNTDDVAKAPTYTLTESALIVAPDADYAAWMRSGWDDAMLVDEGFATLDEPKKTDDVAKAYQLQPLKKWKHFASIAWMDIDMAKPNAEESVLATVRTHPNEEFEREYMCDFSGLNELVHNHPLRRKQYQFKTTQKKERKMSKLSIVNKTLINGCDFASISDEEMVTLIVDEQNKLKALTDVKCKSKAIDKLTDQHEGNITKLIELMDGRADVEETTK